MHASQSLHPQPQFVPASWLPYNASCSNPPGGCTTGRRGPPGCTGPNAGCKLIAADALELTMWHTCLSGRCTPGGHGGPAGRVSARSCRRAAAAPGAQCRRCLAAGARCLPAACSICCFASVVICAKGFAVPRTCITGVLQDIGTTHGMHACHAMRFLKRHALERTCGSHMHAMKAFRCVPAGAPGGSDWEVLRPRLLPAAAAWLDPDGAHGWRVGPGLAASADLSPRR